jgi:hypothetical protein
MSEPHRSQVLSIARDYDTLAESVEILTRQRGDG